MSCSYLPSSNVSEDIICDYLIDEMILVVDEVAFELTPLPIFIIIVTINIPRLETKLSFFIQAICMKLNMYIIAFKTV